MKFPKIDNWLSLVANLGVLIGVFLVAYELQQNRLATEAQTRSDISQMSYDSTLRWAESPEIISTLDKTQKGAELTDQEQLILLYIRGGQLRRWENTFYQYERGLFDEIEFEALT